MVSRVARRIFYFRLKLKSLTEHFNYVHLGLFISIFFFYKKDVFANIQKNRAILTSLCISSFFHSHGKFVSLKCTKKTQTINIDGK